MGGYGASRLVGTRAVRHNRLWRERAGERIVALIYVTSANPGEGKTGVAAAIARSLAYAGSPVRLVRIQDGDGSHAAADAKWFASLDFAPGSPADLLAIGRAPADRSEQERPRVLRGARRLAGSR